MICAIHQPNFFPWMPFMQKIRDADVFVFLTRCQYEKGGYQNRFNIGDKWYTMSVGHGEMPIRQKRYTNPVNDWEKICRRLPQYAQVLSLFDTMICDSLMETNIAIVYKLCRLLGIDGKKIRMDYDTDLSRNDRNLDICMRYGCDTYLSGTGGGRIYNDHALFEHHGVKIVYQENLDRRHTLEVLCDK